MSKNEQTEFTATLSRDINGGEWMVDRFEFHTEDRIMRTVLKSAKPISAVFHPDFCKLIEPRLPRSNAAGVASFSTTHLELPEIVLGGLRVLTFAAKNGIQKVLLRFAKAIGRSEGILIPDTKSQPALRNHSNDLAARTLVDLVFPCIALADVEPPLGGSSEPCDRIAARLDKLSQNKNEIAFYAFLLGRFLRAESETSHAIAATPISR